MRAKLAVLAAVALFGAACGGSSGVSIGSDGTVRTGDAAEFCAFLESDTDSLEAQFGGGFDEDMGVFREAMTSLRDSAPDEISDDMDVLFDVTMTLVEAFDGIGDDDPAAIGRMMEVAAELEPRSAEIEAAAANVQEWAIANCDVPEDFAVFESGLADDSFGSDADTYGDDPALDALWDDCAAGDLAACDSLWFDAPFGSEYESFGDTCGGTQPPSSGGCEFDSQFGSDPPIDDNLPMSYGDDADLDALWDDCEAGDLSACDSLYYSSPLDSDYETFALSCGGTSSVEQFGTCVTGPDDRPESYGDDPFLDRLYDDCADGDLDACDSLYFSAPIDSDYELFGQTCGGTSNGAPGTCAGGDPSGTEPFGYGDDAELDALYDDCQGGDLVACDDLYYASPIDSDYEFFGATCGGRSDEISGFCADPLEFGGDAFSYGDDPILDALWDDCEAGVLRACDDLWWDSPVGSEYEAFAESCGGRSAEPLYADCEAEL